ncbi:tyrosine-type recombinase/integrase [Devosia sp.]|uniref:tyrosine-type recombinase/integrase n=1 Tax=Devosia sp. TaxID=1871048 RepID=UPI0035ADB2E9
MKKALTAASLAALKPTGAAYYLSDAKQDGLRVRVAPAGGLTWVVAYRVKGRGVTSVSLGVADPTGRAGIPLADARDRAASILKAARAGRDLLSEERAQKELARNPLTVEQLIARYYKDISSPNRRGGPLRTADEIERRLRRALAGKLSSPVDALTRGQLSLLLDEVAERFPREAEKRRQGIHAMLRWAKAKGYAADNPLEGTPGFGTGQPRDRVLDAEEIRSLWLWFDAGADNMPSDVLAALRLQLLLGARSGEVAGMEASEIAKEGDKLVWTLPARRSKNKRPRITPLSGKAAGLVEQAMKARPSGALFRTLDGSRALTSTDVGQALLNREKTRPIAAFTTHDLRRTVVSKMDELGISLDTIAAVIGHQRGSASTRVLVRHYSRPVLDAQVEVALNAWAAHLAGIVEGKGTPSNVLRFTSSTG